MKFERVGKLKLIIHHLNTRISFDDMEIKKEHDLKAVVQIIYNYIDTYFLAYQVLAGRS